MFPRRSLASDAERFEGRGPTATEEVNEALGLPRNGGASFVLGGATPLRLASDAAIRAAITFRDARFVDGCPPDLGSARVKGEPRFAHRVGDELSDVDARLEGSAGAREG